MMSLHKISFVCACFLAFIPLVSADNLKHSINVSEQHPLFEVERNARVEAEGIENPQHLKRFAIDPEESLEETYRKLILLHDCFYIVLRNENREFQEYRNKLGTFQKFLMTQFRKAHEAYPGSAPIAVIYASFKYFHTMDILETAGVISSYLHEWDRIPAVPRVMASAFELSTRNLREEQIKNLIEIFDLDNTNTEPQMILHVLSTYWATKIEPSYSTRWTEEKVAEAREKLTEEDRRLALHAWRQLVDAHYDASQSMMRYEVLRDLEEKRRQRRLEIEKQREEMEEKVRQDAIARLVVLEEEPNTWRNITEVMRRLSSASRGRVWEEERIPNYEAIKEQLGEVEAETINAYYILYVRNDIEEAAKKAEKLLIGNPEDTRLLLLKAKQEIVEENFNAAKATLEKILEINPNNWQAKNILMRIEHSMEEIGEERGRIQ